MTFMALSELFDCYIFRNIIIWEHGGAIHPVISLSIVPFKTLKAKCIQG